MGDVWWENDRAGTVSCGGVSCGRTTACPVVFCVMWCVT